VGSRWLILTMTGEKLMRKAPSKTKRMPFGIFWL